MKKLSVTGADGMLGSDLVRLAASQGWEVAGFDLPKYDITNQDHLRQIVASGDVIVNCAAYTNVDLAETETERCAAANAVAPGVLGELAAAASKHVIHVSTDFVYGDLTSRPQREDDPVNPLGVYGRTKLAGEQNLLASASRSAIIRVQWSYGVNGVSFVGKLTRLAAEKRELKVVADQVGAPTWTADSARAILALAEHRHCGVFNFAAAGYASRFEVARLIVEELALPTILTPCSSSEFPSIAVRPLNSRFDCARIEQLLGFSRPEWQASLRRFLSRKES